MAAPTVPKRSPQNSFLDCRGFVWAFAHVRGGGELGAYWYQAGKLLNKRNTFIDFIACAEHLIKVRRCIYEHQQRHCSADIQGCQLSTSICKYL